MATTIIPPPPSTISTFYDRHSLLLHAQVYVIAEQYNVPGLKKSASDKYEETAISGWDTSAFVKSLQLIYEATLQSDKGIRKIISKAAAQHGKDLVKCDDFLKLCTEVGEVGCDILKVGLIRRKEQDFNVERCHIVHGVTLKSV